MKKKLLNVGACVLTVTRMALLMLTLVLTSVEVAQAQTETAAGDQCAKKRDNGDCGTNDCPKATPNCHIKITNKCGCEK